MDRQEPTEPDPETWHFPDPTAAPPPAPAPPPDGSGMPPDPAGPTRPPDTPVPPPPAMPPTGANPATHFEPAPAMPPGMPPDPFMTPGGDIAQAPPGAQPPTGAPSGAGYLTAPSAAYGQQMKQRGPFLVWFVWPLITLGIYHLVWYYKIHREMHDFNTRQDVPVSGPVLVLIFLSWTVVAPLISYYNTGKRIADAQRAAGMVPTVSPLLGMLLMIILGLGTLYYQIELNKITAIYGYATPGTMVPLAF